jgi:hypothetical protein
MKNKSTSVRPGRAISVIAQESLGHLIRPNMPPLISNLGHWEPRANYVIAGKPESGARPLALTLAEKFAGNGGHVIWIGTTQDMRRMYEQLMFKIAGLELPTVGADVQLDAVGLCKLEHAHEQIGKMWIDFCNVEDCGDIEVEHEFLASVSSFRPTLIVVDESIFDEVTLNPFEILVRQTHALRMVEEIRGTNPMCSVLWQLSLSHNIGEVDENRQCPSIDNLPDAANVIEPDVVLFTLGHAHPAPKHNAELVVASNAFGPTGTLPMVFDCKQLTWHELDAVT